MATRSHAISLLWNKLLYPTRPKMSCFTLLSPVRTTFFVLLVVNLSCWASSPVDSFTIPVHSANGYTAQTDVQGDCQTQWPLKNGGNSHWSLWVYSALEFTKSPMQIRLFSIYNYASHSQKGNPSQLEAVHDIPLTVLQLPGHGVCNSLLACTEPLWHHGILRPRPPAALMALAATMSR